MKRLLYLYLLPILMLAVAGCRDESGEDLSLPEGNGNVNLLFSVSVPAQSPKTYALGEADENRVATVDILAFKTDGTKDEFAYRTEGRSITDDGATNKKKFEATLHKDGSNRYRFVILANAKDIIDNAFPSGINPGEGKEEVLSELTLNGVNGWNSEPGTSGYLDIPMWGETGIITVQENTPVTGISLLRMLSKINLQVDPDIASKAFTLSSVRLYNYHQDGRLVPDESNLEAGSTKKVTLPTATGSVTKGPVVYDAQNSNISETALNENIYTFESEVPYSNSEAELDKMTCLVVGGRYDGSADETFYRLDFGTKDKETGKVSYYNLLRNHRYNIRIVKVNSAGYTTPEEAFNARAVNIEAELVEWDEGWAEDVVVDGNYMLYVSAGRITLSKEERTALSLDNIIYLATDYPGLWEITGIEDVTDAQVPADITADAGAWLKTTVNKGTAVNTREELKLLLTANDTGKERKAKIYIGAGRLTYVIEVTQTASAGQGDSNIRITDASGENQLAIIKISTVVGEEPTAEQFKVLWSLAGQECSIRETKIGTELFVYDGAGDNLTTLTSTSGTDAGNGTMEQLFTIKPAAFTDADLLLDPLMVRGSLVEFYSVSNGAKISRSIVLNHSLINISVPEKVQVMPDGGDKSFEIKANTGWRIESAEDDSSHPFIDTWYQPAGSTGQGNIRGESFRFKVKNITDISSYAGAKAVVKIRNDEFGIERTVEITLPSCGTNGTAISQQIGEKNYLTHYYNTGIDGEAQCWMVENSKQEKGVVALEKQYGYDQQPEGERGYYYYDYLAYQACPDGWHIPSSEEAGNLKNLLSHSPDTDRAKALWFNENQYAGWYSNNQWHHWGSYLSMLSDNYADMDPDEKSNQMLPYTIYWFSSQNGWEVIEVPTTYRDQAMGSVRCVKDNN